MITAGGAGMFCGSCMHDNTWARALMSAGAEVSLLPTYTPIRLDEPDVSSHTVFLGGLNVYLEHRWPMWRGLPRWLTRWLDHPALIRWATRFSVSNDARELGDLTLDMLAGESGPLCREVDELAEHIACGVQPDVVIFSNALLAGALRRLKERFRGPVLCTLQGDDVFLDVLPDTHRQRVISLISERSQQFDGFITHTQFYRDLMSAYLRLPAERFHQLPLGIDLTGHGGGADAKDGRPFTVGYFARIAPEKGLHHLAAALLVLHGRRPGVRLRVGGYLGPQHQAYFRDVQQTLAPMGTDFVYCGSPASLADKVAFYQSLDVLSVPTDFFEPKGLYVLEALANGVPVVQPAHGAFPELLAATGGGRLVEPRNPEALADVLEELMDDPEQRKSLAARGRASVRERFSPEVMAAATLSLLEKLTTPELAAPLVAVRPTTA